MTKTRRTFSTCRQFSAYWVDTFNGRCIAARNETTGQVIEMLPARECWNWEREGALPSLKDFAEAAADREWDEVA